MKSLIHELFTAEATVVDTTSAAITPQRLVDETGAFQIEANTDPDPGGGSTGRLVVEGRLDETASWVIVAQIPISNVDGTLSAILTDVPIVPFMRLAMRNGGGTAASGGTGFVHNAVTWSAWLME